MDGLVTWAQIIFFSFLIVGLFGLSWKIFDTFRKAVDAASSVSMAAIHELTNSIHRIEIKLAEKYVSKEEHLATRGELHQGMQIIQSSFNQRIDPLHRRPANLP